MRRKHFISVLAVMFSAGLLLASCVKEGGGAEDDGRDGDRVGNLNFAVGLDGLGRHGAVTRAATDDGEPEERNLRELLMVLYDVQTGKAVSVTIVHNISWYGGRWEFYTEGPGAITVEGTEDNMTGLKISLAEMAIKEYDAVLVGNYRGANNMCLPGRPYDGYFGNFITAKGHSIDVWAAHIDYTDADTYYNSDLGDLYAYAMQNATGMENLYYPDRMDYHKDDYGSTLFKNSHFLMFNADGPLRITADDYYTVADQQEQKTIAINLERTVAKVVVAQKGLDNISHGATVSDLRWVCDMINMHTFPMRQRAYILGGTEMETAATAAELRYATDPNFSDEIASGDIDKHFFRHESDIVDGTDVFFKSVNASAAAPDNWEYVLENTMAADRQHETQTTRALVRCTYQPAASQYVHMQNSQDADDTQADANGSYYSYEGHVLSVSMISKLAAGSLSANDLAADSGIDELNELAGILVDGGYRTLYNNFDGTYAEPFNAGGLNFHYAGKNFYSILLRHFDHGTVNQPMAYGRYGVVRNNTYRVTITNINGPGSAVIPTPDGPDDKTPSGVRSVQPRQRGAIEAEFTNE